MTHPNNEPTRGSDVPRRTEVLVVGAGPTGLSLACGLAKRGIDHVVIDHAPRVAAYSQSAVVDARTLEVLDNIDASDPLIRRGVMVTHFTLRDGDEELLSLNFSDVPTKYRYTLMVPESVAESVLSERLASYGSSVLRPVTAVGLQQDAEGVTVELWDGSTSRSGGPSRRSIFARYVVGCDGMHSQVRSALQRMNAGIQDALHLADKLADVLTGIADDSVLKHYEAERRPVAEAVLGLTRKLSGVATLRGQAGQRIRNQTLRVLGRLPAFRQSLASRLSGFAGVKRSRAGREESQLLLASTRR